MFKFLINDFCGPLDLLLHLIKQSKMDINDIKIVEITEQYVKYINDMENLNLDIASEYLVMATELVLLKSKSLLPKKEEENFEEEIESVEDLQKKLIMYKRYKEQTNLFKDLESTRKNIFTKVPTNTTEIKEVAVSNDGTITIGDLMSALQNVLERQEYLKPKSTKITKKELSVDKFVVKIRNVLVEQKKVMFSSLFDNFSKPYVIVTFLSILEMAKNKELFLIQDKNFDMIYCEVIK